LLSEVRLENADFSNRRVRDLAVVNATLIRCDFSRTRVTGGVLGAGYETSEYLECVFDGCHLSNVLPGRATFINCSFRDVSIRKLQFQDAQFIDCVFTGLLESVTFSAVPLSTDRLGRSRNTYRGNDFSGAWLSGTVFRGGIDLTLQRLPDDPDHVLVRDAAVVLPKVREQVARWPERRLRDEADASLWMMENDVATGQRDLLVSRSLLGHTPEATTRLVTLLTG
jgi:Pentapeptide repeats (8 copies)